MTTTMPLLSPASSPDREAQFNSLVALYGTRLYRAALRQLGDAESANDALQDGLLLAYRHLDQFQGRSGIATWLTRIVINAARGQRRRTLAHPASSLEVAVAAGRQFSDGRLSPEARCVLRERRQCLHGLLARLSPRLRLAIEMCDLGDATVAAAARQLGIKTATLRSRLCRARRRMATLRTGDLAYAAAVQRQLRAKTVRL